MRGVRRLGGLRAGTLEVVAGHVTSRGVRGLVLASSPIAAALGAEVIREGGNAYDGVVVAALAETVLMPSRCGLAGDLVALRVQPNARDPEALIAVGEAPAALRDSVMAQGLEQTGPRSVGVPGAPSGYAALASHGLLPLSRLVSPAVVLAREGIVWSEVNASLAAKAVSLVRDHNSAPNRYFPDWDPLPPGTVVRLPGMAELLEEFATRGQALFEGPVGEEVVAYIAEQGGILRTSDFERARAEWAPALKGIAGERVVWSTPPPTHGSTLLRAMVGVGHNDSAGAIWDRVHAGQAARSALHDSPGTSIVSAADSDGNAVVLIHSNSFPWYGSGLVVPKYDLVLNNRPGRGFGPEPTHPNFPNPGHRPATTLHAWALADELGHPAMLGGTPGGENQMPLNAQLLTQAISGEHDLGMLVVAPRWQITSDGGLVVEDGFSDSDERELSARASVLQRVPRWGLDSTQQVIRVPRPGEAIVGAVDPRTGGAGVAV